MADEKLDYKKEYKDLYMPGTKPCIIDVPAMCFIMVDGKGNPNIEGGGVSAGGRVIIWPVLHNQNE